MTIAFPNNMNTKSKNTYINVKDTYVQMTLPKHGKISKNPDNIERITIEIGGKTIAELDRKTVEYIKSQLKK
jgi:hypothetical protein